MNQGVLHLLDLELGLRAQGLGWIAGIVLLLVAALLLRRERRSAVRLPAAFLVAQPTVLAASVVVRLAFGQTWYLDHIARLLLLLALARLVYLVAVNWFLEQRLGRVIPRIFGDIVQAVLYVAVSLIVLRTTGVDPGSLLTTSALLTAVIGLSLQETLGNLFAGLAVQTEKPFALGDWIQFQDSEDLVGEVVEINWRATRVVTSDSVQVVVPNSVLAKAPVRNFSRPSRVVRRSVRIQGPYELAPGVIVRALLEAVASAPRVLTEPRPQVFVSAYADSGIEYDIRFFIDDFPHRWAVDSEVRQRAWYAFQRSGISCPYPVRDLRQTSTTDTIPATTTDDKLRWLRGVEFLDVLTPSLLQRLASQAKELRFHAGDVIVSEGDSGTELYVVVSGEVEVMVGGEGQPARLLATLGAGRLFGELASVADARRTASVRTRMETTLLVIDYAHFGEAITESPALRRRLESRLVERLAQREQPDTERADDSDSMLDGALLRRLRDLFSL
jgi:small-conductance mechanosensitive channel/CRP-like cAMP-binding protein